MHIFIIIQPIAYTCVVHMIPYFRIPSSSTSRHHLALIVLLMPKLMILRLYTSINAVRYINPFFIGIYVISVHQTWLGLLISRFRNKYGFIYTFNPSLLRFFFLYIVSLPISLNRRLIRFGPTRVQSGPFPRQVGGHHLPYT